MVFDRWLGYGTMWILTVHGCGFYGVWLWDHDWLRGLVWDRNGTNMLAGTLSWLSGCALWFTSLEYVRRNYFEVGILYTTDLWQPLDCRSSADAPCLNVGRNACNSHKNLMMLLLVPQLFYKTHILGFLGFMLFGFMHHTSLWAYTMPGQFLLLNKASRCRSSSLQSLAISLQHLHISWTW
jgi:hypothetical protein